MSKVIAYTRVSTAEQSKSGLGLDAQRSAILREAAARGWSEADIEWIEDAGFSARSLNRPGLALALEALRSGDASVLIVSKTDRLSRSLIDFVSIMQQAQKQGWILLALDSPTDMSTPAGEMMASMLAVFGQMERRIIGQRTADALAAAKERGVKLGNPKTMAPAAVERILTLHRNGLSYSGIARQLHDDGIPTTRGGKWQPTTVRNVVLANA